MNKIFLIIFFIISKNSIASDDSLTISYTEKPPYYYSEGSSPKGFLVEKVIKILAPTKINYKINSFPPMRIVEEIKRNKNHHCSIGWFKNEDRKSFAQFSEKIHTDKKMIIVTNLNKSHFFRQISSFKKLKEYIAKQENKNAITLGTVSGFSYGSELDHFIKTYPENSIDQSNQSPIQLLQKIALERVDYGFFDQEEFNYLNNNFTDISKKLKTFEIMDFPLGQNRYLMCSLSTPIEIINSINKSIKALE